MDVNDMINPLSFSIVQYYLKSKRSSLKFRYRQPGGNKILPCMIASRQ